MRVQCLASNVVAAAKVLLVFRLVLHDGRNTRLELTIKDCGWFVRTWNMAPAFASNCSSIASSGVTFSIL